MSIDVLLGQEFRNTNYKGLKSNNYGYFHDRGNTFYEPALGESTGNLLRNKVTRSLVDRSNISYYGVVSAMYGDRYVVNANIRFDGSNLFGSNPKYRYLPLWSVSGRWIISNESFLSDNEILSNLALRASYGLRGNIVEDSSPSIIAAALPPNAVTGLFEMEIQQAPNPDLKWETSKEFNIGLDWAVLDERLSGSIDVYLKKTSDMLYDITVQTTPNLYNKTLANAGKMRNQGIEIAVNAIPVRTKDFEWKTTVTASHNANKLLSLSNDLYETSNQIDHAYLGEPINLSTQRMEVGRSMGQFYGMKSVGVSENGLWMVENTKTGEIEEFTDNMLSNDDYRQYLGNALPKLYLGWNNSFRYKNFDLSFQMTGQFGFKILNEPRAYYENNSIAYNRLKSVQKAPYGGQYTLSTAQKQTFVSYYLEDGDFLKMTNITLGYNIPLNSSKFVKNIRAYVSADNLFCITGYDGLDPEMSNSDIWSLGIDWRDKYPSARSFTFGLNVSF